MSDDAIAKGATDAIRAGTKIVEGTLKKAWSILDAASEKKQPSEVLNPKAVKAIQGQKERQG